MNRLLEIGFEPAGHWLLSDGKLKVELTRHATQANVLYAFVCDGDVMYVGKSVQTLSRRMAGYKAPAKTQITNINNNRQILDLLSEGSAIEILALPDNGLLHYGKFHLNLAAALEDDIIRTINPKWNGGKAEPVSTTSLTDLESQTGVPQVFNETFCFVLQPTYFRSGFFNVDVSAEKHLGADAQTIELFLGDVSNPILGTINRRANTNGTPRIMGGAGLRDWFEARSKVMAQIAVEVISPTSIRLKARNG